jgi:integrase
MISRLGRAPSAGRLRKERRGKGPPRWVLDYKSADGARHRQCLSTDRGVAERLRTETIRTRDLQAAGLSSVEGMSRSLAELKDIYLEDLATRAVPNHIRNVRRQLERVLSEVRAPRVRDLQSHVVMQHRARRVAAGASHTTANIEIKSVKALLNWAVRVGLIKENPIAALPHLPQGEQHQRRRRRAMSDAEIERFLAAAAEDDRAMQEYVSAVITIANGSKGPRWASRFRGERVPQLPMWRMFLDCGPRYGELTRATWADVDFEHRTVTLRAEVTKSGKQRVLPLSDTLVREIRELRGVHERVLGRPVRQSEVVFRSPEGAAYRPLSKTPMRTLSRILDKAKIAQIDEQGRVLDVHSLRHTCASRLARRGVPITTTQRLLGHSSVELTSRYYTHLELNDLRAAVESMEPTRQPNVANHPGAA